MNAGTLQRLVACAAAAATALEAFAADVPVRFMTYNVQYCRYLPEGATSGRFDGGGITVGWTDICDNPYPETVEALRGIACEMYNFRAKGAAAK